MTKTYSLSFARNMSERKAYTRTYLICYKYRSIADGLIEGSIRSTIEWTDEQAKWDSGKKYKFAEDTVKVTLEERYGKHGTFAVTTICNLDEVM
jgi:hypothetical protein